MHGNHLGGRGGPAARGEEPFCCQVLVVAKHPLPDIHTFTITFTNGKSNNCQLCQITSDFGSSAFRTMPLFELATKKMDDGEAVAAVGKVRLISALACT